VATSPPATEETGQFLNKFSRLQKSLRLQKSSRLGNVGFWLVGAYGLRRRELAPTQVLKNWPLEICMGREIEYRQGLMVVGLKYSNFPIEFHSVVFAF
jgi:hypothetical protein